MLDILPYPRIVGDKTEEKISSLIDYLIQVKEELEFALRNISTDNLSDELIGKLNSLGADIQKSDEARKDELSQLNLDVLTVSDVINSSSFKSAVNTQVQGITFNVNFSTGNLEFETS